MATEVLLMSDVANLGAEGDVVQVADGYARNYLLPKSLAAPVNEATRRRLEKLRKEREAELKARLQGALEAAKRLENVSCTIPVKTGEDEKLYGSVGVEDIAEALQKQGVELDKHLLQLEKPIKELGVFDIPVKLHPDVDVAVKVWIVEE